MTDPRHIKAVSSWLKALADTTRHGSEPITADKIANMATILAPDFPPGAFTSQSLRAVSGQCEWFPGYAELGKALGRWWHDHGQVRKIEHTKSDAERDAERASEMAREWDDPSGIRDRIATCEGDERFLRLLGGLVAKHAIQHVHLIAPEFWPDWVERKLQEVA